LMPQISDAARVFPNISPRYVPWIERGVGSPRVTQEPTYRRRHAVPRGDETSVLLIDQMVSGTISIAPHGHSAAQSPQPLQ
jgi:hypothetical protein